MSRTLSSFRELVDGHVHKCGHFETSVVKHLRVCDERQVSGSGSVLPLLVGLRAVAEDHITRQIHIRNTHKHTHTHLKFKLWIF